MPSAGCLKGRQIALACRALCQCTHLVVTSLSVTGLSFMTTPGASVHVGDKYEMIFVLDDEDQAVLFEEIVIIRVCGTRVGATFSPAHDANHDLIFFVMSEMSPS